MLVGIDEVGRGCWAGPLVAGAVILAAPIEGLRDSKKLSKSQREKLAKQIEAEAIAVGIGWVSPQEVDTVGLSAAVKLAMERAISGISVQYDEIIIDGNINYLSEDGRSKAVIRADDSVPAVSAASIVAKVARDAYMERQAVVYPGYAFERHVGYGTKAHTDALRLHGITPLHRLSYKPIKVYL